MKLPQTGNLASHKEPWTLIRDAIHDLTLQENTPGIKIDMDEWHHPNEITGCCEVCFAGSTMARRLCTDTRTWLGPYDFNDATAQKLEALNHFRLGNVSSALLELGLGLPPGIDDPFSVTRYAHDPSQFKEDMLELARKLEFTFVDVNDKLASFDDED